MDYLIADFNGADRYFSGSAAAEWHEIEQITSHMPVYLQRSDQAGRVGTAIFDPKGTNEHLTREARKLGWSKIPVPQELTPFGVDWDAGKGRVLAEWQFSNYPFLWNNVIRSEAVYKGNVQLPGMGRVGAMIVITKCGLFPSSNSTLYFEQGRAQMSVVTRFETFSIPIRLVGLSIQHNQKVIEAAWSDYGGRYHRAAGTREMRRFAVVWGRAGKYGNLGASFVEE